jgi:hypothetical protein
MNGLYVEVYRVTDITWHHLQKEFGKNVPVVSAATVEKPAGLTDNAVDFRQQPTENLRLNANSV